MKNIIAISGSLRKGSFNTALLHALKKEAPADCHMEIVSIEAIPLYNFDVEEASGVPAIVEALKEKIATADGLLISSPEYNHSIPGVLKNALDWLTRPPKEVERVFHHRKVGIVGASPSGFGTVFAQTAWLPILRYLKVQPFFAQPLFVSQANQSFDEKGKVVNDELHTLIKRYMADFYQFIMAS